ncbi:MAG: hypothetical protein Q9226_008931 [Calogaya cf. arnoldii]
MTSPAGADKPTYTVGPNEFFWMVAHKLGVSNEELAAANGMDASAYGGLEVKAGQVLYIPSKDKDIDMDKDVEQSAGLGDTGKQIAASDDKVPAIGQEKSFPTRVKPENYRMRSSTTFARARMQHRDDPAQDWIDLDTAEPEMDTSGQPEPVNLQQVTISDKSKLAD